MVPAWQTQLKTALIRSVGEKKGTDLFAKYESAFHLSYREDCGTQMSVHDILQLERLSQDNPFEVELYWAGEKEAPDLHLRLFQYKELIPLSDILPTLENLGLRTFNETPYKVKLNTLFCWISDFNVSTLQKISLDIEKIKIAFQDIFTRIISGECENDHLNQLVLSAKLSWREITILRAYLKYLKQVGFRFSQLYIEKVITSHANIAGVLIDYFKTKFNPTKNKNRKATMRALEKNILEEIDAIVSLDEDRIMRNFFLVMKASVRTNYFQTINEKPKAYLSIKFESGKVPDLPLPKPLYEIFVYSPRVDGIHLRKEKVARGGIRWSDRPEDFRTEVLGLMKAQRVKNAIIVPSGAKGGFVLKMILPTLKREEKQKELVSCYQLFIRGLLDLTDNIKEGKVIKPKDTVCLDGDDTYLVVAADKGTGAFSDIANGIAEDYDYWLGDAFASGGSSGYNHKSMGITARGAWESIRRHFRELDINIDEHEITVAGIGDMSGDVFGNGMIYSDKLKLVAAFDHRDIFLDPMPDPKKSYAERLRLFRLPTSSWQDYDKTLISKGGGIFSRLSKSITLSNPLKEFLDIKTDTVTPDELVRAILKAPVDLLYNGGIGTYVKSSEESNDVVGDKINDFCRVNGINLRARVVGEGGNLGFTQLGRIEYAMQGGRINTDFIDNSGGVDCSDHEVNIKILLNKVVASKRLTHKKRNELLSKMAEDVVKLVLNDSYNQALSLALSQIRTVQNTELYISFLKDLETSGDLDRKVEFLPSDKQILDRKAAEKGFSSPELAVLMAYSKIHIKKNILNSTLPEESYFIEILELAFPPLLREKYKKDMLHHELYREIIATQLANKIVNEMGLTYVYRIQTETGASVSEVIHAYTMSACVFDTYKIEKVIESLSFKIPAKLQYDLLHHVRHLLNISTRWFLRSRYINDDTEKAIQYFYLPIQRLHKMVPDLVGGTTKTYLLELTDQFMRSGIPRETAIHIATYRAFYILLNVVEVATRNKFDLVKTAKVYFAVGSSFNFIWFRDHIGNDSREGHWNNLARLTLRDELDVLQKYLTVAIMKSNKIESDEEKLINDWMSKHKRLTARWTRALQMLHGSTNIDYTMFFVSLRELADWLYQSELI